MTGDKKKKVDLSQYDIGEALVNMATEKMDKEIKMALAEVYFLLENFLTPDYKYALPKEIYNAIKRKRDEEHKVEYNYMKPLSEQKLMKMTKDILAILYFNYWTKSDEEKKELVEKWYENELALKKELRKEKAENVKKIQNMREKMKQGK
ncbi:MAG: hypothetical protein K6F97_05710 [Lachnospiraceae bacterium]|nr:hypothetical protein [Lachnospiraceae bacterium]